MMRLLMMAIVWLHMQAAYAQTWRDPTAEPAQAGEASTGLGAAPSDLAPLSVIVVDGRPHVIMGTRLYAPGQKLGQARIERITETEVWLRDGAVVRKVSRYPGVERRSAPSSGEPGCAAGAVRPKASSRTLPRGSPCPDAQP